jgi:hypothetical protein
MRSALVARRRSSYRGLPPVSLFADLVRFLACAVVLAWVLGPARAGAEPLRGVVRIAAPADRPLYERVRGQASDLELELVPLDASALEETLPAQLAKARELGSAAQAQVVVWFTRELERLEVVVADLAAERVLVRAIERGEGELAGSAQDEAAALVVRSALKASLMGAALGTPEPELAPPEPEPTPPPAVVAPPPVSEPVAAPPAPRFRLGARVVAGKDGATDPGNLGVGLRFAIAHHAFEFGVLGLYGLPADVDETQLAKLSLSQHRAGAYGAYAPLLGRYLQLTIEAAVELCVFMTEVSGEPPQLEVARERALLAAVSADVGMRAWFHRHVAVGLTVGLAVLPKRPVLGYEVGPNFERVQPLWVAQPRVGIELVTRF